MTVAGQRSKYCHTLVTMADPVGTLLAIASLVEHMKARVETCTRNKRRAVLLVKRIEIILPAVESAIKSVRSGTPLAGERMLAAVRFRDFLAELSSFLDGMEGKAWMTRLRIASRQGDMLTQFETDLNNSRDDLTFLLNMALPFVPAAVLAQAEADDMQALIAELKSNSSEIKAELAAAKLDRQVVLEVCAERYQRSTQMSQLSMASTATMDSNASGPEQLISPDSFTPHLDKLDKIGANLKIGEGGFGVVYRVLWVRRDTYVAVKLLKDAAAVQTIRH